MLKDMTDKFFKKVTPADMTAEEIDGTQATEENLVAEAVILNPDATDPDDIELQMELDDYDDDGEPKSFDAWDLAADAYHAGDAKDWVDNLKVAENEPDQIYPTAEEPVAEEEPMSDEDQLLASQRAMKKYRANRAKQIAKHNAETNLFNFSDALEALDKLDY